MEIGSGWTERPTSNEFARIYDHEAGYIILGILDEDDIRRWDLARGHGPKSRIISEHPFYNLFDAIEAAEMMMANDRCTDTPNPPRKLLRAG